MTSYRLYSDYNIGKGTGLGLTITKTVVDTHNGRIEVVSKEGMGTSFEVYLPTFS
jgi:signal transduction histidine kinase